MSRRSRFEIEMDRQIQEQERIVLQATAVIHALERAKEEARKKDPKPTESLPLLPPEEKP